MEPPQAPEPISVIGSNCYLLPSLMTLRDNQTCRDQTTRATGIANLVAGFDVVALQEVWGSNLDALQQPLMQDYFINSDLRPFPLLTGRVASFFNTASYFLQGMGGLNTFWRKEFQLLHWRKITFDVSETKSRKGAQIAILDVASRWGPGSTLCVVNLHLDPMHPEFQLEQVCQTVIAVESILLDGPWQHSACSVIMIGDFNISSGGYQYNRLKNALTTGTTAEATQKDSKYDAVDLYKTFLKKGERERATYDKDTNSLVIWNQSSRIDFCWNLLRLPRSKTVLRPLKCVAADVIVQERGHELSDHWQHFYSLVPK